MNIGIIQGFVGGGGGVGKTLLQIIQSLQENHNLTLYTLSKPTIPIDKITIKSKLPFKMPTLGLYQRLLESKLLNSAKDEDIIIEASGGLAIPDNPSQKIIVYCHSDFQPSFHTRHKGIWELYYKPYAKYIKKSLENIGNDDVHFISNSNFVKASIQNNYKKDSVVIYPPVDIDDFDLNEEKSNDVITISRYGPDKNLDFALDTIMQTDHKYTLIGNTRTKANILHFEHLYSKSKGFKNIILEKDINRRLLIDKLNKSKVYFHPSYETFGITVIESIAAGCIPVVPDIAAHKETVPIDALRYITDDLEDAKNKINKALSGEFDQHLQTLQQTLPNYNKSRFKESFKNFVENLSI